MWRQLSLLALAALWAVRADDIILTPDDLTGTPMALVFIQGAQTPTERYVPLAKMLQAALAPGLSLWVAIPQFPLDAVNPAVINGGITGILKRLQFVGYSGDGFFMAGHSLGGVMVQDWTNSNPDGIHGQILLGSYLTRKYAGQPYPVPTLTVGGELDGLSRITRIAEAYHRYVEGIGLPGEVVGTDFPVVVLKGVSHNQFASGDPPFLVQQRDLLPEVSYDEAHGAMATVMSQFILARLGDGASAAALSASVAASGIVFRPIINSLELEGFYHFKPPCYDDPPSQACTRGSPWSARAQVVMGGLDNVTFWVRDDFHPVSQTNPVHLPKVWTTCPSPTPSCFPNITTVTEAVYDSLDSLDTAFNPISATELRVKLKARQAVELAAGIADANFDVTDAPDICSGINQMAFDWALANASAATVDRYKRIGQPYVMGADKGPYNAGPLWIWNPLQYNNDQDLNGNPIVTIQSPMMKTPEPYYIEPAAGFHYCKLLSPARAMEWIYVDSLRLRGAVNSKTN